MEIIITETEESGMPEEMINNMTKLLQQRFKEIPKIGEEIDILYSEKDPLMDKGLWDKDDEAYMVYFSVVGIDPLNEGDLDKITITVELIF
jgi:hypothetical protein